MKHFCSGAALSAHILNSLYKSANRLHIPSILNSSTRTVCNVSGEYIYNTSSGIFNFNLRKYSTSAQETPVAVAASEVPTIDQKKLPADYDPSTFDPKEQRSPPTERVFKLVDDIAGLTLLEVADLTDVLKKKFNIKEMPLMTMMMPGMGMPVMPGVGGKSGATKVEENKPVKTSFDLKLESFDAASKIKIIKEVRTFTDLGLKEAKELVEKTPALLKKGVTKEEGDQIIDKLKALGAKVVME
eukprot:Gb_26365 [translate_table: standard]